MQMSENPQLQFAAFIVTDQQDAAGGTARLLGESVIHLGAMMSQLTDIQGVGVRQSLTFFRNQRNQGQIVVGKFNVIIKIVNDYMAAEEPMFDGQNMTVPRKSPSQIHPMPVEQPYYCLLYTSPSPRDRG